MASIIKNGRVYSGFGGGGSSGNFVEMTQAQYNALANPDPDTVYFITDEDANSDITASGVEYDNTDSGLTADTVQDAIDENTGDISNIKSGLIEQTSSANYMNLVKVGKIITVFGTGGSIQTTAGAWKSIGTIPSGFRPKFAVLNQPCTGGSVRNALGVIRIDNSTGDVSIFSSVSDTFFMPVFSYISAN